MKVVAKESTNLPTEKSIQEIGCIKIVMDREPMGERVLWRMEKDQSHGRGIRTTSSVGKIRNELHGRGNCIDDKIVTESTAKEELVAFSIRITSYHASANVQFNGN